MANSTSADKPKARHFNEVASLALLLVLLPELLELMFWFTSPGPAPLEMPVPTIRHMAWAGSGCAFAGFLTAVMALLWMRYSNKPFAGRYVAAAAILFSPAAIYLSFHVHWPATIARALGWVS